MVDSTVEANLLSHSGFDQAIYRPTEKTKCLVVDNFPALGQAAAFRFLEWVQKNPTGVCSLPTGKTPEFFIKWVQKILKEWPTTTSDSPMSGLLAAYGLPHGPQDKPDMRELTFVQVDEFYPIAPSQKNSFHWYVREFYLKGFGMSEEKAMLIDCSVIGLDALQNDAAQNRAEAPGPSHGITGEPEDALQLGSNLWSLDDVFFPKTDASTPADSAAQGVDLSLRVREPSSRREKLQQRVIRQADQWCCEYEERIRSLGGIGFFMGGIGPEGHVAFNCRGCDPYCTTRMDQLNYESQAAASGDLGGITAVKQRKVITIGLGTITFNPDCVALICAAGEAKAQVVRDAIEEKQHVLYPATALSKLKNAVFYVTKGAAKLLSARRVIGLAAAAENAMVQAAGTPGKGEVARHFDAATVQHLLIDLSMKLRKRLVDLTVDDLESDESARVLLKVAHLVLPALPNSPELPPSTSAAEAVELLASFVKSQLERKIERGLKPRRKQRFLHTEPHHDDIMLGYLPLVLQTTQPGTENAHHFVCATSGFNSVSNSHMLEMLGRVDTFLKSGTWQRLCGEPSGKDQPVPYFDPDDKDKTAYRRRDVWKYLDGIAANDPELRGEGAARRLIFNIQEIYGIRTTMANTRPLVEKIEELRHYFGTQYPGQKDMVPVQTLKGSCREFEAECVWGYLGWQIPNISHLRLGFYSEGEIFAPEPTHERDVVPITDLLNEFKPDVVSVALDPEASGPDTHYKVLQAVTAAIEGYCGDGGAGRAGAQGPARDSLADLEAYEASGGVTVWGYRNVWFRFHPAEVSTIAPVSLETISTSNNMFLECFESQKNAEFPGYEIDGPFCALSQKVQVEQYDLIETCLGYEWFHNHASAAIRATRGLVFLKELTVPELLQESRAIRKHTENF